MIRVLQEECIAGPRFGIGGLEKKQKNTILMHSALLLLLLPPRRPRSSTQTLRVRQDPSIARKTR